MTKQDNSKVDDGLQGNEKIEDAIFRIAKRKYKGNAGTYIECDPQTNERKRAGDSGGRATEGAGTNSNPGGSDIGWTELVDSIYKF